MITEAGNDPRVAGLVYIAAFAPDKGRVRGRAHQGSAARCACAPILPPQNGYLSLDKAKFAASFAGDVAGKRPRSWPTRRFPGAWRLSAARSANRRGRPSRAGTGRDRRQDDSAGGPTVHVQARRRDGCRGKGSHAIYVSQPKRWPRSFKRPPKV